MMNSGFAFPIFSCLLLAISPAEGALKNIPDTAKDLGLTRFLEAISKAGLTDVLRGSGPLTLLAPNNEAVEWIVNSGVKVVDSKELTQILDVYISKGDIRFEALTNEFLLRTASTEYPYARVNLYYQGKNTVQVATVQCAPIDLSMVNQKASNGMIHSLKWVIFPPSGNIMKYLDDNKEQFSTLISLVKLIGMDATLSSPGPYTLFAPTNDAFDKLPAGTLDNLRKDIPKLKGILYLHVIAGTYCSSGMISGVVVPPTGVGLTLTKDSNGDVTVQNAKVTTTDGSVTNGVVHHIDQVILTGNSLD